MPPCASQVAMPRYRGDALCEKYYDLTMNLAGTANVETSLAPSRLQGDVSFYI